MLGWSHERQQIRKKMWVIKWKDVLFNKNKYWDEKHCKIKNGEKWKTQSVQNSCSIDVIYNAVRVQEAKSEFPSGYGTLSPFHQCYFSFTKAAWDLSV